MVNKNEVRPLRIAVASTSGVLIDECFGKAKNFRIYEADSNGFRLVETRPSTIPCHVGEHDQSALNGLAILLQDCPFVLAGRIGPGAMKVLKSRGIAGDAIRIGINDAIERLTHTSTKMHL